MVFPRELDVVEGCRRKNGLKDSKLRLSEDRSKSVFLHHQQSCDAFTISHPTRYPPNQLLPFEPVELNLKVTKRTPNMFFPEYTHPKDAISNNLEISLGSTSIKDQIRDSHKFSQRYNYAAKEIGISEVGLSSTDDAAKSMVEEDTNRTRNWLFQRLSHKSSLNHISTRSPYRGRCSLDDVCRLGGLSFLRLPQKYTAIPLLIPTCLAATGNFLAQNGRGVSGVFRIPGQTSIVNALHAYYSSRLQPGEDCVHNIQMTVWTDGLPSGITPDTHDVASTFKRLLRDLPGGVLGSVELFRALKEIWNQCTYSMQLHDGRSSAWQLQRAHLVALRLLSVQSGVKLALIGAVFGLLAYLKRDCNITSNSIVDLPSDGMDSRALSVVFAPVLLGDLTELIDINSSSISSERHGLISPKKRLQLPRKTLRMFSRKQHSSDYSPIISASLDKYTSAVNIAEMLICDWEAIVQQIRVMSPNPSASKSPNNDVSPKLSKCNKGQSGDSVGEYTKCSRSHSLLKSATQSVLRSESKAFDNMTSKPLYEHRSAATAASKSVSSSFRSVDEPLGEIRWPFAQSQSPPGSCRSNGDNATIIDRLSRKRTNRKWTRQHNTDSSSNSVVTKPHLHNSFLQCFSEFPSRANMNAIRHKRTSEVESHAQNAPSVREESAEVARSCKTFTQGRPHEQAHSTSTSIPNPKTTFPLFHSNPGYHNIVPSELDRGNTLIRNLKSPLLNSTTRDDNAAAFRTEELAARDNVSAGLPQDRMLQKEAGSKDQVGVLARLEQLEKIIVLQHEQILRFKEDLDTKWAHGDSAIVDDANNVEKKVRHYRTELEYFRKRWYGEGSSELA